MYAATDTRTYGNTVASAASAEAFGVRRRLGSHYVTNYKIYFPQCIRAVHGGVCWD